MACIVYLHSSIAAINFSYKSMLSASTFLALVCDSRATALLCHYKLTTNPSYNAELEGTSLNVVSG